MDNKIDVFDKQCDEKYLTEKKIAIMFSRKARKAN